MAKKHCVKAGTKTVRCYKSKAKAKHAAAARRKQGKKARVVTCGCA